MALCSAGVRPREVGTEQSEPVHPGCSLSASQEGGRQTNENALKPSPSLVLCVTHAGPRLERASPCLVWQPFPRLHARTLPLGRGTEALLGPFSTLASELCLGHRPRTADSSETLTLDEDS